MSCRYRADDLSIFAAALLERAGLPRDRARNRILAHPVVTISIGRGQ